MKKLLTALALFSMTLLPTTSASAAANDGTAHMWTCAIDFEADARGLQVLIGKFKFKGDGEIRCYSPLTGQEAVLPIDIKMTSKPIALRIGAGRFHVRGYGAQISLFANAPEDLLGKYLVATASASAGVGIGAFAATHLDFPSLTVNFGLQTTRGFGFDIGIKKMIISAKGVEYEEETEVYDDEEESDWIIDYDY